MITEKVSLTTLQCTATHSNGLKIMLEQQTIHNAGFVDRRRNDGVAPAEERRQFSASYDDLSNDARELGQAVDQYKLLNRRRYLNYEELLSIVESLGYRR